MARPLTPEERARQSALIRNWKPWEHSTGAKTSAGKAQSSQNAFQNVIGQMLKKIRQVLREQKKAIERIDC